MTLPLLVLGVLGPALDPRPRDEVGEEQVRLDAPKGAIAGTLDMPAGAGPFPAAVVIAGSGPTNRNGNQPGLTNDGLMMLGKGLAAEGVAVLRYDRRGVGRSAAAQPTEDVRRFDMLADDAAGWVTLLRADERFSRVAVVGHSEGSLVGMLAARQAKADAFVALAGCGRPAHQVLRGQLARNLPKESKEKSDPIIDGLAAGRTAADVPEELMTLFRPSVQPYLISYFKYDPAEEVARLDIPVLIVQGTTDVQTPLEEVNLLAKAEPDARLCVVEGMNHLLKQTKATTSLGQWRVYRDPSVPLAPTLVDAVAAFLAERPQRWPRSSPRGRSDGRQGPEPRTDRPVPTAGTSRTDA